MRIVGIGVDATEIERVKEMCEKHPESFLERVYTPLEREYCVARKKGMAESLAARWAAKEAVMKALGVGWSHGVKWPDIEVETNFSGAPSLNVTGRAKEIAQELGIRDWKISLTHSRTEAIAFVVASGDE